MYVITMDELEKIQYRYAIYQINCKEFGNVKFDVFSDNTDIVETSWCVIKRMNNIMHVCEQSNASMYWNQEP